MSQVTNIEKASSALVSLSEALDSPEFKRRGVALKVLSSTSNTLNQVLEDYEGSEVPPTLRRTRKIITQMASTVSDMHTSVADKRCSLSTLRAEFKAHVVPRMEDVDLIVTAFRNKPEVVAEYDEPVEFYTIEGKQVAINNKGQIVTANTQEDAVVRKDRRADNAVQQAKATIQRYKNRYDKKVPARLTRRGAFQVVSMPVLATFKAIRLRDAQALSKAGLDVTPLSVQGSRSSDVGIVFDDQYLLVFSESDAKEAMTEVLKEEEQNSSGGRAQVQKRNLNRQRKKVIQELSELQQNPGVSARVQRQTAEEIKGLQEQLVKLDDAITKVAEVQKRGKQTFNRKKRVESTTASMLFKYATQAVNSINDAHSQKFVILADRLIRSTKNNDIVMCWIMEKGTYSILEKMSAGDPKVLTWDLPWQRRKQPAKV